MKPLLSFTTVLALFSISLIGCTAKNDNKDYVAYKVVANDDTFGYLNNLNDTLNNMMKGQLEASQFKIVFKERYASITQIGEPKSIVLARTADNSGAVYVYEGKTNNTETNLALINKPGKEIIYIVYFRIRADRPVMYPAQMGGAINDLNYNVGRAICYLAPTN